MKTSSNTQTHRHTLTHTNTHTHKHTHKHTPSRPPRAPGADGCQGAESWWPQQREGLGGAAGWQVSRLSVTKLSAWSTPDAHHPHLSDSSQPATQGRRGKQSWGPWEVWQRHWAQGPLNTAHTHTHTQTDTDTDTTQLPLGHSYTKQMPLRIFEGVRCCSAWIGSPFLLY